MIIGPFDRATWCMLLCLKSDLAVMKDNNLDGKYTKFIKDETKHFKVLLTGIAA